MSQRIRGVVTEAIYRNEDSGYSVIEINAAGVTHTVTGVMPGVSAGEQVECEGNWTVHPQYGKQFKATALSIQAPDTLRGIERFLSSGLIKGVGPSTARAIVERFGRDTLDILLSHPERLMEISGIGPMRCKLIAEGLVKQYAQRNAMIFLQSYGVSPALAMKISKQYQTRTEQVVRRDPYRLIDEVPGVGFKTADGIATALGLSLDSPARIGAGIKYALQETAAANGHTYFTQEELIGEAAKLLRLDAQMVANVTSALLLARELTAISFGDGAVQISLPAYALAEQEIAVLLFHLSRFSQQMLSGQAMAKVDAFEKAEGVCLSALQREAAQRASQCGVLVITGGPGTGKTTLIKCILAVLGNSDDILLAAPTGRAAKRMSEATGHDASTLHRLLALGKPGEIVDDSEGQMLDCSTMIVDEVSMVDIFLMRQLLRSLPAGTRLILCGDADQLPSVGPGNVLHDILASGCIPQVRLTEIFRQQEQSQIVRNAHRINRGQMPVFNSRDGDFFLLKQPQAEAAQQAVCELYTRRLIGYQGIASHRAIQVLSPTRKGACGVGPLNAALQAAVNPEGPNKPQLQFGEIVFRQNDRVIHVKNNYQLAWNTAEGGEGEGVFNGDIGYITAIDRQQRSISVQFEDARSVQYEYEQLEELELAYCLSVHKSQGSEFDAVIILVTGGPPMLLNRNLFYTAVTRAKRLVVLVGTEHVIQTMVSNNTTGRRNSTLEARLRALPFSADI